MVLRPNEQGNERKPRAGAAQPRWPALVLMLAAFGNCGRAQSVSNEAALESYTKALAAKAEVNIRVQKCQMWDDMRIGYCVVHGPVGEPRRIVERMAFVAAPNSPSFQPTCQNLDGFGRTLPDSKDARLALPGVERFVPGPAALPPTTSNVHLVAIYLDVSGEAACIDYAFPYG